MRQNNNNKFKERRKINTRRKSASVPGEIHRLLPHIFFEIFSSVFFCFFFFPALLRNISGLGYERKKTQGAVRNDNKAFLERKRKWCKLLQDGFLGIRRGRHAEFGRHKQFSRMYSGRPREFRRIGLPCISYWIRTHSSSPPSRKEETSRRQIKISCKVFPCWLIYWAGKKRNERKKEKGKRRDI